MRVGELGANGGSGCVPGRCGAVILACALVLSRKIVYVWPAPCPTASRARASSGQTNARSHTAWGRPRCVHPMTGAGGDAGQPGHAMGSLRQATRAALSSLREIQLILAREDCRRGTQGGEPMRAQRFVTGLQDCGRFVRNQPPAPLSPALPAP